MGNRVGLYKEWLVWGTRRNEAGHDSTVRHIPGVISSYNNVQILCRQFRNVSIGEMHRTFEDQKNTILYQAQSFIILMYIQRDATLHSLVYLETALHISGGAFTHHQEQKQLYLQHLLFVTPLLLPAAIAAGSSNGLTNTRCCRYSCLCSWWWVKVPPETCRAVSR